LENLLEWSQLQRSSFESQKEIFDLFALCKKVVDLFQQNAQEKNIKFEAKLTKNSEVYADENMIYTVLRNLVANAIKFTKPGGKES